MGDYLKLVHGLPLLTKECSGKVEVVRDILIISVNGPSITGSTSFITCILTLSGPDDLLEGMDLIICCISVHETG